MFLPVLLTLTVAISSSTASDPRCALLAKYPSIKCEGGKVTRASTATEQPPRSNLSRVAQEGRVYYPLAYGVPGTEGTSMRGFNSTLTISALKSFPYRYDQFYRGPRKRWW
jgi:hypothetical protein